MPSLTKLKESLSRLTLPVIQGEVQKIVQSDPEIVKEKTDEFRAGQLPNGSPIGTYASESYRLFKLQKNPLAGGNVDLILTGAFTKGLVVQKMKADTYRFTSTDEKTPALQRKYGIQIWGLNENTWQDLQKVKYAPMLYKRMREIAKL